MPPPTPFPWTQSLCVIPKKPSISSPSNSSNPSSSGPPQKTCTSPTRKKKIQIHAVCGHPHFTDKSQVERLLCPILTDGAFPPPHKRKWSHLMDSYLSFLKYPSSDSYYYYCEQKTGSNLSGQCFSPLPVLHLIRGRVRSLKCVVRAPSCQTFWRVRLIAHRLPGLFVWYISNKLREAFHFSFFISLTQQGIIFFLFLWNENTTCTAWRKTSQNVASTDYSGRAIKTAATLQGEEPFNNTFIYIIRLQMDSL